MSEERSPPTEGGPAPSRHERIAKRREALLPDPIDRPEVLDRPESAARGPLGDDPPRERRTDALEPLERLGRGRGERDPRAAGSARSRRRAGPRRRSSRRGRRPGRGPRERPRLGTTTCWPSLTRAARFTPAISARRVSPPARRTATPTRAPSNTRTSPGLRTSPATDT